MLRYALVCLSILCLVGLSNPFLVNAARGPDPGAPIKVGVYQNEPLVFVKDDDSVAGVYVDLINYIASREQWTIEYVPGTWSQCLEWLESGEIDLLVAIEYSEERSKRFDFTNETVLTNWGQIYSQQGVSIQSILDLNGKTIAVARGDIYYRELREMISSFGMACRFVEVDDYATVFRSLDERTADVGLIAHLYGTQHEMDYNVDKSPVICCPKELRFAAPRGENQDLLQVIDGYLVGLKADQDSVYHRSLNRWLGLAGTGQVELPEWVLWALGLAGGLAFLLLVISIILRSQVRARTSELSRKNQELQVEIVERERAQEALRESAAKFRAIVESIPIGMLMCQIEPENKLIFSGANPAADRILGIDHEELVDHEIDESFPPLVKVGGNPERYRRVASEGQAWQTQHATQEGGQIQSAFEVHAFQALPGRMVIAFLDITERRQAVAEITRLQHLLQNITDSMPSALITLDPAGRVLTWNPAAEALTGRRADQVQGQSLWQACPELLRYRDLFERVIHGGQIAHQHKEQLTTEPGAVYRDVSVFPLEANDINGAVLRIDDVTRRVQLEDMMLQSAKMASVGGLAAGVAHEINNPLGAMMQSAQMLQLAFDTQRSRVRERLQDCGVDPAGLERYLQARGLVEYLEGIRSSGERAAKIVSDLLSFSRKSSSKAAPHDLNQLVEQTIDLAATDYDLKKRYDFRDMEVVRELAPSLPKVMCDGQQIQQVVLNLVRNAAHAMSEEKRRVGEDYRPRLTLRTSLVRGTRTHEPMMRLEVEDNGPGIPEEARARLFEPFFTTKGVGKGTGLGLWLCWSIVVERHKGRIWARPGLDSGSRFVVELPIASQIEE